jgi:hypothetical protein
MVVGILQDKFDITSCLDYWSNSLALFLLPASLFSNYLWESDLGISISIQLIISSGHVVSMLKTSEWLSNICGNVIHSPSHHPRVRTKYEKIKHIYTESDTNQYMVNINIGHCT